ncbi:MAG: hypothetical protein ACFB4I_03110 [Cyanophyceae cyanobacterium]
MPDTFAMNTDWAKIAYELRQQNRELTKMVIQLEQTLAESQEKLQAYVQQSLSQAISTAQPAETDIQQQIAHLFQEISASYQVVQHQQIIAKLTKQLETSQARVAQLERDCALLQENYNEQHHQLLTTTEQAQALRHSLQRQEHCTLAYKEALSQRSSVTERLTRPLMPANHRESSGCCQLLETLARESASEIVGRPLTILPWSEREKLNSNRFTPQSPGEPALPGKLPPIAQTKEQATAVAVQTTNRSAASPSSTGEGSSSKASLQSSPPSEKLPLRGASPLAQPPRRKQELKTTAPSHGGFESAHCHSLRPLRVATTKPNTVPSYLLRSTKKKTRTVELPKFV